MADARQQAATVERDDSREARAATRSARDEGRIARSAAKEAREQVSPLKKLIYVIELGAIGAVVYALRKPVVTAVNWVENELKTLARDLDLAAQALELGFRAQVSAAYLEGPAGALLALRLGGGMAQNLSRGAWATIYTDPDAPPPAEMADQWVAGYGPGAVVVPSDVIHLSAYAMEVYIRWIIERSPLIPDDRAT